MSDLNPQTKNSDRKVSQRRPPQPRYLQAILDETLRVKPPSGGGFRLAEEDLEIGAFGGVCFSSVNGVEIKHTQDMFKTSHVLMIQKELRKKHEWLILTSN